MKHSIHALVNLVLLALACILFYLYIRAGRLDWSRAIPLGCIAVISLVRFIYHLEKARDRKIGCSFEKV